MSWVDSQTHIFSPDLSDIMFRCLSETAVYHAGKSLPRSLDCYAFQEIKAFLFPNRVNQHTPYYPKCSLAVA